MSTIARNTRLSPPPLSDRARRLCEDESGLEHDEPLPLAGEQLRTAVRASLASTPRAAEESRAWRGATRARPRL